MAERKPEPSSEKDVKAPNIFERGKEEIEALIHNHKSPRHTKETHGTSGDIDEKTPIDEVKGPNVFERVKEEVEAIVEAIHQKKESKGDDSPSKTIHGKDKAPNIFERAKEELEAVFHHHKSPRHTKETHGTSDDIDVNTPVDEVKGPNVFERVKEEVEAIVEAIHHRKDSKDHDSPSK